MLELVRNFSVDRDTKTLRDPYQRILFPEPAEKPCEGNHQEVRECKSGKTRTFAMNPQERACRSPFFEGVALDKP